MNFWLWPYIARTFRLLTRRLNPCIAPSSSRHDLDLCDHCQPMTEGRRTERGSRPTRFGCRASSHRPRRVFSKLDWLTFLASRFFVRADGGLIQSETIIQVQQIGMAACCSSTRLDSFSRNATSAGCLFVPATSSTSTHRATHHAYIQLTIDLTDARLVTQVLDPASTTSSPVFANKTLMPRLYIYINNSRMGVRSPS